jgi:hypothetical protein
VGRDKKNCTLNSLYLKSDLDKLNNIKALFQFPKGGILNQKPVVPYPFKVSSVSLTSF